MHSLGLNADALSTVIRSTSDSLTFDALLWVSANRDFAETDRYDHKDAVDTCLTNSRAVAAERASIERLFEDADSVLDAVDAYLELLRHRMRALNASHLNALATLSPATMRKVWANLCDVADVDNAHAMYLSSDNWPFSVFHGLVNLLEQITDDDDALLGPLLTAGVLDIRTVAWAGLGDTYIGLPRRQFVEYVIETDDWLRPDGTMPIVSYESAVGSPVPGMPSQEEAARRFRAAFQTVCRDANPERRPWIERVIGAYMRLYQARIDYDTYEYFGAYAFLRHVLIRRTIDHLVAAGQEWERFHQLASTYQFAAVGDLIKEWR